MELKDMLIKLNRNWGVSSKSKFTLEDTSLIITLDEVAVSSNMQNNEAAFEAWAICLKTHLKDNIKNVIIRFDESIKLVKMDSNHERHLNRCLYRLDKFRKLFSWVTLDKEIETMIPNYSEMDLLLNFPISKAQTPKKTDSEAALERKLVAENPLTMEIIDHQMPIGVFKGEVSEDNIYMNSRKAALDLWGIKGGELFLYELKKVGYKPIGIISELLFYTNIFNDVRKGIISYPSESCKCTLRHFQEFRQILTRNEPLKINSVFIAPKLHPMITDEVIKTINDSEYLRDNKISLSIRLI